jgi:DNA primase
MNTRKNCLPNRANDWKAKTTTHSYCMPSKRQIQPEVFYSKEFSKMKRRGEWATVLCPFHDDHEASLSVNLKEGHFKCFACGAKGGDVVDFVKKRYGLGFKDACKKLGVSHG